MIDSEDCAQEAPRRRSLLPQRSSAKQPSTRGRSITGQKVPDSIAARSSSKQGISSGIAQCASNRKSTMQPPNSMGRLRTVQESTKNLHSRAPITGRPSSQVSIRSSSGPRTTSAGKESEDVIKAPHHGRSVSHQLIQRSVMPGAPSSRLPASHQPSVRSQKTAPTAMQHSSAPKKAQISRPPSPSRQPATKDSNCCVDFSHQQMELAQLHLLHRSANLVQRQWEESAKECFRTRFDALLERHLELREIADQQQALINQLALVKWSQNKTGAQAADKVALLSRAIADVCSLVERGGKYTKILEIFESWFVQALQTREQRTGGSGKAQTAMELIEGIGDGWKAESMVLERELTYCLREIKAFGPVRPKSSLGRVVFLHGKLVQNLLEELDAIQWIENEITTQEASWVENTIQRLASDVNKDIGSMAEH